MSLDHINSLNSINSSSVETKITGMEVEEITEYSGNPHKRKKNLEFVDSEEMREVEISTSCEMNDDKSKETNWITTIKMKLDYYIGHVKDAPHYSRDNEFILSGYRINFNSCKHITKSLCMCHNETVNVWTHLIGALVTIIFIIATSLSVGPYGSRINQLQTMHKERVTELFHNYSIPFYSSLPVFQNGRVLLNTLVDYSIRRKNLHLIEDDSYRQFLPDEVNMRKFTDKMRRLISNLKTISSEVDKFREISCYSCVEDFMRNLYTLKLLYEETEVFGKFTNFYSAEGKKQLMLLNDQIEKLNSTVIAKKGVGDQMDFNKVGNYVVDELKNNSQLVIWPIYVQLVCAIFCLCCSSTFHLFVAYGATVGDVLARLDYAGISILIAGSCYPPYYYMFYCSTVYLGVYLSFISIFALSVFLSSLTPSFNKAENRRLRGFLFLTLGISAGVPVIHLMFFSDESTGMIADPNLLLWVLGGLTYISGCLIYISRTPERCYPGKFDLIGSSHQIWHIFVLGGIYFHHFASINSYYDRLNHSCPA